MSSFQDQLNYGKPWTRDELILAFELYCRIPFQKTKATNPEVRKLAIALKRSPASVARKLGNFGAFDPELKERNISGLAHGSRLDRQIWDEFHHDWNTLVLEAHRLRTGLLVNTGEPEKLSIPTGKSERIVLAKQRIHQQFFRETVLSSYEFGCCITGLPVTECLVASHIVPWSADERYRADPTNGLCLSATFDRLFDSGLITVSADMKVRLSRQLLGRKDAASTKLIVFHNNQPIILPRRFSPSRERLAWHEQNIFKA